MRKMSDGWWERYQQMAADILWANALPSTPQKLEGKDKAIVDLVREVKRLRDIEEMQIRTAGHPGVRRMNYREKAERLMEETDRRATTYDERAERYERALREAAAEAVLKFAQGLSRDKPLYAQACVEAQRIREGRDE